MTSGTGFGDERHHIAISILDALADGFSALTADAANRSGELSFNFIDGAYRHDSVRRHFMLCSERSKVL